MYVGNELFTSVYFDLTVTTSHSPHMSNTHAHDREALFSRTKKKQYDNDDDNEEKKDQSINTNGKLNRDPISATGHCNIVAKRYSNTTVPNINSLYLGTMYTLSVKEYALAQGNAVGKSGMRAGMPGIFDCICTCK
jgi:hypothetical protein